MVSDYVMLQQNCQGSRAAFDSVGLASYTMDSHNIQRVLVDGFPRNEGDVQVGVPAPYSISYRSIVPRAGECENLFVTFALSASHMGFGSCRMEPVLMITSQSAATAATIAIDDNVPVQQVGYPKLNAQLLADKQLLYWGSSAIDPADGIIVDSEDTNGVVIVGTWTNSAASPGFHGAGYLHDDNTNRGSSYVRLTPNFTNAGTYAVYLRWAENANRASNASVTVEFSGGITNVFVNQRTNGGTWFPLGTFAFDAGAGASLTVSNVGANGFVIADAALWLPPASSLKAVEVFAADPVASENTGDKATVTFWRSGDVAGDLAVSYTVSGTATPGTDFSGTFSSIRIPAGQVAASLQITSSLDTNVEGAETIIITIATNAAYTIGALSNVMVTLLDESFDGWRATNFTPAQLADPQVSGEGADADNDGVNNLAEFLAGTNPNSTSFADDLSIETAGTNVTLTLWRHRDAANIALTLESSTNLTNWIAAAEQVQQPAIVRSAPYETLRYLVSTSSLPARFWRMRLAQPRPLPLPVEAAFLFSFDTLLNGNGLYDGNVTANSGFSGAPVFTRSGTIINTAGGGGANFTDYRNTNWMGSGGSNPPGHSSGWNPGSSGNSFSLTFSTLGFGSIDVRFDIRSAAGGAGATPPTQFNSFTFDVGNGPQTVPAANLAITANNAFNTWSIDLSSWIELENQPSVTLTWTFDDLANKPSPLESVRVDNIQVRATIVP